MAARGQPAVQFGLQDDEDARDQDQHRNDHFERPGRELQQQDRAGRGTGRRGGAEPQQPSPLPGEFLAVAVRPAGPAGNQPHVVGHVGGDRGDTEGQQGGKRYQRAGTHDRVDPPGGDTRSEDRDGLTRSDAQGWTARAAQRACRHSTCSGTPKHFDRFRSVKTPAIGPAARTDPRRSSIAWVNPSGTSSTWCVTSTIMGALASRARVDRRRTRSSRPPRSRPAAGSSSSTSSMTFSPGGTFSASDALAMPIRGRRSKTSTSPSRSPRTSTVPSVGNRVVAATWRRVVLPAPFGPIRIQRSSSCAVQSTLRSSIDVSRRTPTPRNRKSSSDIWSPPFQAARRPPPRPNLRYDALAAQQNQADPRGVPPGGATVGTSGFFAWFPTQNPDSYKHCVSYLHATGHRYPYGAGVVDKLATARGTIRVFGLAPHRPGRPSRGTDVTVKR